MKEVRILDCLRGVSRSLQVDVRGGGGEDLGTGQLASYHRSCQEPGNTDDNSKTASGYYVMWSLTLNLKYFSNPCIAPEAKEREGREAEVCKHH